MKNKQPYLDIFYNNKRGREINLIGIAKDIRSHISLCDDNDLDNLKWEMLRHKKNYDGNNLISPYMIALAIAAIIYGMFGNEINISQTNKFSELILICMVTIFAIIGIIPVLRDLNDYSNKEHYFDIYYQIIEEEIEKRSRIKELEEKRRQSDEHIKKILDKRNLLLQLGSLFRRNAK